MARFIPVNFGLVLFSSALVGCESTSLFDTYLVKLDLPSDDVATFVEDLAEELEFEPIHVYEEATQGFQVRLPIGLSEIIEDMDEVEYVVIDNPTELTPEPSEDAEEVEVGTDETPDGVARIDGPADFIITDLAVAVIDTGVDLDHPDLNVVASVDIVGESGGEDVDGDDLNGHGTHVAGTIGAIADADGVVGVAPGVEIHAVRVLDENGSGTFGDIISGLEYVLANPEIRVVNMSLGGAGSPNGTSPLKDAIEAVVDSGVVVVIAAGNETMDTKRFVPAGYDLGIVVSAYDADGDDNGFAWFSNYGDAVDVAAPGVNIASTYMDGDYAALSGTSMAAPHVAGAAASYLSLHDNATPEEVLEAILETAETNLTGETDDHPEPLLDLATLLDSSR